MQGNSMHLISFSYVCVFAGADMSHASGMGELQCSMYNRIVERLKEQVNFNNKVIKIRVESGGGCKMLSLKSQRGTTYVK